MAPAAIFVCAERVAARKRLPESPSLRAEDYSNSSTKCKIMAALVGVMRSPGNVRSLTGMPRAMMADVAGAGMESVP